MATSSSSVPVPSTTSPLARSSTTSATPSASSSVPTTATTSAAASTPSNTSSTASTTSGATSTQSSSTTAASTSPLTSSQDTSGGSVSTVTSTSFVITGSSPTAQSKPTSNSFFSNTGAVAGVFTVVGLIVVAFIIALLINAVRRRRAEKFDRDVAEAAAEAAASSRSPFDEYSYGNSGGNGGNGGSTGGGGGYGYSDNSHGTYQLSPLAPHDAYGMSEMSQYDPYAAGAASLAASAVGRSRSRKESEPGTPGIAGVGAGTLVREPSKRAPYHAFAGPGPQPYELQASNGTFRSRRSNQDVLEAAGLAGAGAGAIAGNSNNSGSGAGGAYVTRRPSDTAQNTPSGRSKFGSMSSGGHHPTMLQPGYPVDSYYPQRSDSLSPDPFAGYPPAVTSVVSKPLPNPHDSSVPLSSLAGHQSDHEDNGESGSPVALRSDEQRMSYQDDTDYSQRNRVLRVANE